MSRARVRRVALITATVAVLFTAPALPAYADTPAPPDDPLAAAQEQAVTGGQAVPVDALTTATYSVTANPDGSFTSSTDVMPVRVQKNGGWTPVDATLTANLDGSYSPAATPNGITLSGGGSGPLVTLHHADGASMSLSVPFALPSPTVAGADATYPSVLPGVDLSVSVTDQGGFSDVLIVHDAQAATNPLIRQLTLAASTDGLTLSATPSGGMEATADNGDLDYTTPQPLMWDSGSGSAATASAAGRPSARADAGTPSGASALGPGPGSEVVPVPMATSGDGLTLSPDQAVLTDPDTTYPLYIDPATNPVSDRTGHYDEVYSNSACSDVSTYDQPQTNGEGVGYQGYGGACGNGVERSYYAINTGNLTSSMVVSKASIAISTTYAASHDCSHNQPITLHTTDSISKTTDWQNKPSTLDSDYPAVATHVASGANTESSCSNHTADFDVTSQAQTIADRGHDVWTIGLFGDESSSDPDNYLRMSTTFVLTVTFDIPPSVPTSLHTVPAATNPACTTSGDGWLGAVTTTGGSSNVKLAATVTSNVSGETVAAHFHVWDRTVLDSSGAALDKSTPATGLLASGTSATVPVGFVLKDGHEYGWDVYAEDKVGLSSAISDHCWFKTDFTPPQTPTITDNPAFPRVGDGAPTDPTVYATPTGTTTFTVTGTDSPATDSSCTPDACLSSGVDHFVWGLDSEPTASSNNIGSVTSTSGGVATGSVKVPVSHWGVHTLYVDAVDAAGNLSQAPSSYTFVVPWNPNSPYRPGDITGDGRPDLLVTTKTGDLEVLPGGMDPASSPAPVRTGPVAGSNPIRLGRPAIVSTAAQAPGGSDWTHYLLAHGGNLTGGEGDDLYAYQKDSHQLYLVKNDLDPVGDPTTPPWSAYPGYIDKGSDRDIDVAKPSCAGSSIEPDDAKCRATDYPTDSADWSISQFVVAGNVYHDAENHPTLITVENNELWSYQTTPGGLTDPRLIGDGDWSGLTLLAPGTVNGTSALWARDNATGALYSYSLAVDSADAVPLLHAATRTTLPLTLPPATYPFVTTPGDVNSSADDGSPDGCTDLYAVTTKGELTEYQGTKSGSTCGAGFTAALPVGTVTDTATHWWSLDDGTGTTAADRTAGLDATLNGAASWTTDTTRGESLNLTGTTGYAETSGPALDTSKSYTVSAWVKLDSTAANSTFVSQSDSSGNTNAFQIYYSSGANAWAFNRHNSDNTVSTDFTGVYSSTAPTVGKWTRLVAVYDSSAHTMTLYVNGALAATTSWTGTDWNAAGPLEIGRRQYAGGYGEYADGEVSDVRVYDTALPFADAVDLADSPKITQLD
ncbi:Concanavalin A-like lectin/glucanases superfamily protein [Actinacidiphila guanduensis]|uniref:Concanavalin A-like lectin/glucanases superfamily protein n=2 Tax=Actinacidiphila guanduensis TaxID=310781 RepID=A0A1G9ZH92_9ACTN|nr:Concanavalin A-like lectin/glucanases superfamily protein [Actinacidiphila guanduensis]